MTLSHAATKSLTNFSCRVVARVDLRERAELGVRAEHEVDAAAGPFDLAVVPRLRPSKVSAASDVGFHSVSMSSRFTKKSLVSVPGRLVNTPTIRLPGVHVQRAQAAHEHGHLGRAQRQPERPLDQQMLGRHWCPSPR